MGEQNRLLDIKLRQFKMGTSRASKNLIYKAMGLPKYIGGVAKRGVGKVLTGIEGRLKKVDNAKLQRDEQLRQSSGFYRSRAFNRE